MRPWLGAGFAVAIVTGAVLSPRVVPYSMDEFVHYHSLGCAAFPLSAAYNLHREACREYDLRLLGTRSFLPLRSYLYIGSLPVLPFYPFWRLIGEPVAARLQGSLFLFVASFLLARLLKVSAACTAVASAIFPLYPASFLVDTGPVGLSLVLLLGAMLLLQGAKEDAAGRRPVLRGTLAGLITFLGILTKPVFAWCVPALVVFSWRGAPNGSGMGRRRIPALAPYLVSCAVPTLLLLTARDRNGTAYYESFRVAHVGLAPEVALGVVGRFGRYLSNGSLVLPEHVQVPASFADAWPALASSALLAFGLWVPCGGRGRIRLWASMALLTLGVTTATGSAWAPHHFVFTLFFLVGALALAIEALHGVRRALGTVLLLGVLTYWASLALRWPGIVVAPGTSFAKDRLTAFVRREGLDRSAIQVHVSWGTYYIAHLFGDPRQVVLYETAFPDRPEAIGEVRALADAEGRGVLMISARRPDRLESRALREILGAPVAQYDFGDWRLLRYLR